MVEDLYHALTRLLYDEKKFAEALILSEKGRQQLLVALRPPLEFIDEDRRSYYDELISYADRFLTAASLEMEGKGDEAEQGTEELVEGTRWSADLRQAEVHYTKHGHPRR